MDYTVLCPLLFWREHQIFTFSFDCGKGLTSYFKGSWQYVLCLSVILRSGILSPIADWYIDNLAIPGMINKFTLKETSQALSFH